jgi:hypothetical protein
VQVDLNFIAPSAEQVCLDMTVGPARSLPLERHAVSLHDAAQDDDPRTSLRTRGFAALPFDVAAVAPAAPGSSGRFCDAVCKAIAEVTGARRVRVSQPTLVGRRGDADDQYRPVDVCHADYTAASAAERIAELDPQGSARLLERRFAVYNVWWLASAPPQDRPLALCDANSVAAADLVNGSAMAYDTRGEAREFGSVALFRYNPRQQWYWYPELRSDRLLVFAGFDSDPGYASLVPHTAFVNPACPPGTPTRESIECRCFALW